MDGPRKILDEKPDYLMFLLHGYGADGNDLFSLTSFLNEFIPEVSFIAPNAPFECPFSTGGRQWFSIDQIDKGYIFQKQSSIYNEIQESAKILENFIDIQKEKYSINNKKIILFGFSQGAMMSLHLGLRLRPEIACIISFSGALMSIGEGEEVSSPPIFLAHGSFDNVVDCNETNKAYEKLLISNKKVEKFIENGLAHSIGKEGLAKSIEFIKKIIKN